MTDQELREIEKRCNALNKEIVTTQKETFTLALLKHIAIDINALLDEVNRLKLCSVPYQKKETEKPVCPNCGADIRNSGKICCNCMHYLEYNEDGTVTVGAKYESR